MNKVLFITGASRGMGVDIARAALAGGQRFVELRRRVPAIVTRQGKSHAEDGQQHTHSCHHGLSNLGIR